MQLMNSPQLIVSGISHHMSSLKQRSAYAWSLQKRLSIIHTLLSHPSVQEALIIATCNRTEIICMTTANNHKLNHWLHTITPEKTSYQHHNKQAIHHILRTLSGLDSKLCGETEILGQYKKALQQTYQNKSSQKHLPKLINRLLFSAKQIRHQSGISSHHISLAQAVLRSIKQHPVNLRNVRILFIGAGQIIQKHLKLFHKHFNLKSSTIVCKNPQKYQSLTSLYPITIIRQPDLTKLIEQHDCIISATNTQHYVLQASLLNHVETKNKLFFDLAVPRDIEPISSKHIHITHLDDLTTKSLPQGIIKKAESLASTHTQQSFSQFLLTQHTTLIKTFRNQWFSIANTLIQAPRAESTSQQTPPLEIAQILQTRMNNIHKTLQIRQNPPSTPTDLTHSSLQRYAKQLAHTPTLKIKQFILESTKNSNQTHTIYHLVSWINKTTRLQVPITLDKIPLACD